MHYANVVFNLKIKKSFTYSIPEEFLPGIAVGQRVLVPFGTRELTGILVNIMDSAKGLKCKDIIDVLDEKAFISKEMLELTRWMSDYYMTSWGKTLNLALPKGLEKKSIRSVKVINEKDPNKADLTERQRHLYDIIAMDPGKTTTQYKKKFGSGSFDHLLRSLYKKELVSLAKQLAGGRIQKKTERFLTITDNIAKKISVLRKSEELLPLLKPLEGKTIAYHDFRARTNLTAARIKTMVAHNILEISEKELFRSDINSFDDDQSQNKLNEEQKSALQEITNALLSSRFNPFLLHGVTGSGKTQIYLEAIQKAIALNKSAIVLIPEISLTPQTVGRFESFFPGQIYVYHSRMSLGSRYDTWRKIEQSERCIVIGPRSALFLPVKNPGIIIIDEEHDTSYKQDGQEPRYHARDTAIFMAKMIEAPIVLGSATPSMESFYNAREGKYNLLRLKKRVDDLALPQVHIIDMKKNDHSQNQTQLFSAFLLDKIKERLQANEQVILLQNRRGFSSFLQCKRCGYSTRCPDCDINMTYHTSSNNLRCHYCGYISTVNSECPKCSGLQIKFVGAGTEQIEKELKILLPDTNILRMDIDSTTAKGAHFKILNMFKNGKAEILLGTQMIAKGLDFGNVSLVGVISADIGLTLPDLRSTERIFQLLTQVAGRSGRKLKQGEVVIQTRMPDHYAIQFARNHDYDGFYYHEIEYRKETDYPPYTRIIKIGIHSSEMSNASRTATEVVRRLRRYRQEYFQIIGPAPAPLLRLKKQFRWQVIIKINPESDPSGRQSRKLLNTALGDLFSDNIKHSEIYVDVDPVDMM
jgi:primosomal protein N' (replication factor Y)